MSTKGHRHNWMRAALQRGDLASRAEAREIHPLNLSDALAIVVLMAGAGDRAFDRAAARWLARLGLEKPVDLHDLSFALAALTALPRSPDQAKRALADVCARHRLPIAIGLPGSAPELPYT